MIGGWPAWRPFLVAGAVLLSGGIVGGGLLVWSGLYNVSAARDHFPAVTWLLELVRVQSVRAQSAGIEVPRLDRDMVRLGAAHYEAGCAWCHGAPGRAPNAAAAEMLPAPPALDRASSDWSPAELFWIVHNGQKYTGMPAWPAPDREDEVWALVAFLQALPGLDGPTYAGLAGLPASGEPPAGCARCHGAPGEPAAGTLVPSLSGQPAAYLARALREYAAGSRQSGIMRLVAADLTESEIDAVAASYAGAAAVSFDGPPAEGAGRAYGAEIAERGLPGAGVPACLACHDGDEPSRFPDLTGQPARYIAQQLELWRRGLRDETPAGAIMSRVATRLPRDAAEAVAAYLQSLPAGSPTGAGP